MGCTSSKQARQDRRSDHFPPPPLARSHSLPRAAQTISETYHLVALTSTTLGSLKLDHHHYNGVTTHLEVENTTTRDQEEGKQGCEDVPDFAVEVLKARTWSTSMERRITRIPRTPTLTPPDEPETINAWELMEDLDDSSPFRIPTAIGVDRSFSFHAFSDRFPAMEGAVPRPAKTVPNSVPESGAASPGHVSWLQMSPDDSLFSDFDPDIIASFRKALAELSPKNGAFTLRPSRPPKPPPPRPDPEEPNSEKPPLVPARGSHNESGDNKTGIVKARVSEFQEKINKKRLQRSQTKKFPAGGEDNVVFYFTSLRGVRKTYEDCCGVRLILNGYGVRVDERDVSMHQRFKDELIEISGREGGWRLPRLFVKGRDLGGAEEVMQLHEAGELEEILRGCDKVEERGAACGACGDVRFVNCETCYGSCKVYFEDEGEESGEFQRCPDCNENGIIRCPICCC